MELNIQCLKGDCLELMKTLPDKSIDLFLCDLPYGILNGGAGKEKKKRLENGKEGQNITGGCDWDVKINLELFWIQVKRLCKNDSTPILMFCNTGFGNDLINSNKDWFRYDLVWNKDVGTNFLAANKKPMSSHEMIYVFGKKGTFYKRINNYIEGAKGYNSSGHNGISSIYGNKPRIPSSGEENYRCPLSVVNFRWKRDKRHPTAKPIDLLKWLIERYSNEGDTILDPTAGSFNSGRAAMELNRNYIGMEMNDNFFQQNNLTI